MSRRGISQNPTEEAALLRELRVLTEEWLSNVDATDSFEHALTLRECAEQVDAIIARAVR